MLIFFASIYQVQIKLKMVFRVEQRFCENDVFNILKLVYFAWWLARSALTVVLPPLEPDHRHDEK